MRSACWVAIVLFAGCLGAGPAAPGAPTSALPRIELHGCENLGGVFAVPLDDARALLPPGFEPLVRASAPQPTAVFYVIALACASAAVDGVDVGPAALAYEEIDVKPPAAYASPDITDYVVPVLFTAQPAALGDALGALHLGRAGPGSVTRSSAAPADIAYVVTMGKASFTLRGVVAQPAGALSASTFRVFGVQDRVVKTSLDGATTATAGATGGVLTLRASGDAPLLDKTPPATQGYRVATFDFSLKVPR